MRHGFRTTPLMGMFSRFLNAVFASWKVSRGSERLQKAPLCKWAWLPSRVSPRRRFSKLIASDATLEVLAWHSRRVQSAEDGGEVMSVSVCVTGIAHDGLVVTQLFSEGFPGRRSSAGDVEPECSVFFDSATDKPPEGSLLEKL
uniref:Putative secreted protein n=1 Tax=Ixodes ricinus TaxID=34613 RepID=A0A6B0UTY7_IXORI